MLKLEVMQSQLKMLELISMRIGIVFDDEEI